MLTIIQVAGESLPRMSRSEASRLHRHDGGVRISVFRRDHCAFGHSKVQKLGLGRLVSRHRGSVAHRSGDHDESAIARRTL